MLISADWTTVIISTACAAIIAIVTSTITIAKERKKLQSINAKADIEKAIQLAEIYAKELVPLSQPITYLLRKQIEGLGVMEKLNAKRENGDLEFTKEEADSLFHNEKKDISDSLDPYKISCNDYYTAYSTSSRFSEQDQLILLENADTCINDLTNVLLRDHCVSAYGNNKQLFMNRLEAFAMYFMTDIADQDTVYQSLHQTFMSSALLVYYDISSHNTDPKDYYYTNVIGLFNKWNAEFKKQLKKEEQIKRHQENEKNLLRKSLTKTKGSYKNQ